MAMAAVALPSPNGAQSCANWVGPYQYYDQGSGRIARVELLPDSQNCKVAYTAVHNVKTQTVGCQVRYLSGYWTEEMIDDVPTLVMSFDFRGREDQRMRWKKHTRMMRRVVYSDSLFEQDWLLIGKDHRNRSILMKPWFQTS